jgi:dipeptidyl aminopeptidase/acylaminoacyl peptidase
MERDHSPTWTPELAAQSKIVRSQLHPHPRAGVTWVERRPDLGGRSLLMAGGFGSTPTVLGSSEWSVAASINEYGGRAYAPVPGRGWWVMEGVSARLGFLDLSGDFTPVLSVGQTERFGDFAPISEDVVVCVREDHSGGAVTRSIVEVRRAGTVTTLYEGRDFLSDTVVEVAGTADASVAFVAWDHPELPWRAGEVWRASWSDGSLSQLTKVGGGAGAAAFGPSFSPEGLLTFALEVDGYVQIVEIDGERRSVITNTHADHAEPPWTSQERTYVARGSGRGIGARRRDGVQELVAIDGSREIEIPTVLMTVEGIVVAGGDLVVLGATASSRAAVWSVDEESGTLSPISAPANLPGIPRAFTPFPVTAPDGRSIEGFLGLPEGREQPPLIVHCHGGPTDSVDASFDPVMQVLLDAGYAVALVNYRGSTGFGAAYRDALDGEWGVVDVADVCDYARGVLNTGLVHPDYSALRGGSAGGFTALRALDGGSFLGAVSLYGVTDLVQLAASCHDFEAHYLDHLVGPLPETRAIYDDRSPALHPERIGGAVLLLQGTEDAVVPLEQARMLAASVNARGGAVRLVEFDGEGHGFRRAETIERALREELAFYANLFAAPTPD